VRQGWTDHLYGGQRDIFTRSGLFSARFRRVSAEATVGARVRPGHRRDPGVTVHPAEEVQGDFDGWRWRMSMNEMFKEPPLPLPSSWSSNASSQFEG
jgi:hypothetical protein